MSETFDPDRVAEVTFDPHCGLNTPDDVILQQVATNIRRGLPQAMPYLVNSHTALVVCGGPSLADTEDELREAQERGGKVIALNGAYRWCVDRGIRPSSAIMLDARQSSARFVGEPVDQCCYFLAAQCHPDAFDACRGRRVIVWHALSAADAEIALLDEYYFKRYHPVTLGTTVGMRAISLLRMIGFEKMELFGLDSCVMDGGHHAFSQPENDGEETMGVWVRPEGRDDLARRFTCTVWHAKQAEDFINLIRERGDMFQLRVHGDGLIAYMVSSGAKLEPEENT